MNLREALEDPNLLGRHFAGPSFDAWRAVAAALEGLPLKGPDLERFRAATGRTRPPCSPVREAYSVVGRRGGKSQFGAAFAVHRACFVDYAPHLAPGERVVVAIVAADRAQARVCLRYVRALLDSTPMLRQLVKADLKERIELRNGVDIEVATCSYRAIRGRTYAAVVADELAFWRDDSTANPDVEVLAALRPGMATIPGSLLLGISSPYSRRGVLWEAFKRHHGHDDSDVLIWQAGTRAMNPEVSQSVIDRALAEDEPRARAEFLAEFRSDLETFVAREAVEAATVPGRRERLPAPGIRYMAFCDPSGGSSDSMTLAIAHQAEGVAVLDCLRERRPPFSPEQVVAEFAEVLRAYRCHQVTGDRYGAEWVAERFLRERIRYKPSEHSKSQLYAELLPALNSGNVELLDQSKLIAQLCSLERRAARAGRESIDHPPGAHDDLANAVAGALVLVGGGSRRVRFGHTVGMF